MKIDLKQLEGQLRFLNKQDSAIVVYEHNPIVLAARAWLEKQRETLDETKQVNS